MPALRDALRNSRLNLRLACSGLREPSGDTQLRSRSMNSTYPPGLVCLQVSIRVLADHKIVH